MAGIILIPLRAQEGAFYFNHLTRDDGLSSNRVNFIAEDSLGFIWFATEEGLNKFDGYDFETFNDLPSADNNAPDNAISCILEDRKRPNFWLGTHQGLVYFDRYKKRFSLVLSRELKAPEAQSINISSLCFDRHGNLWIGTPGGLFSWNDSADLLTTLIPPLTNDSSYINVIYKDRQGRMWIGSEAGLFLFRERDSTLQGFHQGVIGQVTIITEDSHNDFLVGTDRSGLYILEGEPGGRILKHISKENGELITNRIYGIIEDTPGFYFILNRDGGLYTYDRKKDLLRYYPYDIHNPDGINSTALISGFKSSQNIIWIGTYNSGINYLDKAQKKFLLYRVNFKDNGLFNNNIRALAEDPEGYIWIGTKEGGGLSRFDKKNNTFRNYRKSDRPGGLRDDYIFSVCALDQGHLLIGTFREGLALFDKKRETFRYFTHRQGDTSSLFDNRVYCIFRDDDGTVWVGNYENLQLFDPAHETFRTVKNVIRPRCFCEGDGDRLWIGSSNGLYLLNKKNGNTTLFLNDPADTNSLCSNDIYSLTRDKEGYLWIGTRKGLNRYDPATGIFMRFTVKEGMPANWVRGLLADDEGNIWAGTTNGITRYEPKKRIFHNYDVSDRLQGNEFERYVSLKTRDGFMLFGGHNGFNMFRPEEIIDNKRVPAIYITGFDLFNREVDVGVKGSPLSSDILFTKKIVLKHNQTAITLKYLALNYTSPEKNQYAYMLEGFDQGWISAGSNRAAVYTNIPPGEYVFRVTGSNNDNYWNKKGTSLSLTILPPPWKTGWAYLIYALIFSGIFLAIRRILIVRIEQKKLLEYERIDKKRIQEMNQEKLRFFTNISHEFRTPLTLIAGPLEKLLGRKGIPAEEKNLLHLIKNNVNRLLMLVNELMEFRKAEHGLLQLNITENDLAGTIRENIECFEDKAKEKNIRITFEEPEKGITGCYDRNIINKVLFNLLSNAIKFTPEHGKIRIRATLDQEGYVTLSVANTGKGIPAAELDRIFERFYRVHGEAAAGTTGTGIGLTFARRLMEKHKGTIAVKSDPGEWTVFTIRFPVEKKFYTEEEIAPAGPRQVEEKIKLEPVTDQGLPAKGRNGRKILIVEDNEELRNYLRNTFSDYDVLTAADGKEGVEKAKNELPELIISDIMMPEMDGLEMCARIKEYPATSHIPVILLTAKADIEHKIKGVETGADVYIEKPFRTDYLAAVVKNLIMQREKLREKYSGGTPETDLREAALTVHDEKFIEKVRSVIEKNISEPDLSVEKMANELGMSRSQLFRKFGILFDRSPNELIRTERLKYARHLLLQGGYNVNEVADMSGFSSTSYFITSFRKQYGKTPARVLKERR